jgi:hypothetical protein
MLFDLIFPCYMTTFSGKKCLSGKVICAYYCPAYRSSPVQGNAPPSLNRHLSILIHIPTFVVRMPDAEVVGLGFNPWIGHMGTGIFPGGGHRETVQKEVRGTIRGRPCQSGDPPANQPMVAGACRRSTVGTCNKISPSMQ